LFGFHGGGGARKDRHDGRGARKDCHGVGIGRLDCYGGCGVSMWSLKEWSWWG
jgi:hypothetical protein